MAREHRLAGEGSRDTGRGPSPPSTEPESINYEIPPMGERKRSWRVDPIEYVRTNPEDLNRDLAQHQAKIAWIGVLYADAKYEREKLKAARDRVEAELIVMAFEHAATSGKKPTGKEIDAVVCQQDPYITANEQYLQMARVVDRLDGMKDSLNHRIQAMVTIGANLRRERESGDPGRLIERIHDKEQDYERLRAERSRLKKEKR